MGKIYKFINLEKDYNYGNYWNQVVKDSDVLIKTILKNYDYFFEKEFLSLIYGNVIKVEIQYIMKFYDKNFKYDLWTMDIIISFRLYHHRR